jgi:hypothetical protein
MKLTAVPLLDILKGLNLFKKTNLILMHDITSFII